jgi:type I restriction enzyme S subunit
MNETLEAIARALFKSWFADAVVGDLPNGWTEGAVGDVFNVTMGQSPPGETYNEIGKGLPFFQGRADFGFRFPSLRVYCTVPTRMANAGDTLVSVRAPVGDVNMASERCCIGRGLAAVRHKTGSRSYTYYAMRTLRADFDRFEAEGTVFGSMGKKDFHTISYVVPPAEKVKKFEALVSPLDQLIENNESESHTLAALRDTLLPKLISGELRTRAPTRHEAGKTR